MSGYTKWTSGMVQRIIRLREKGLSSREIADIMGLSPAAVRARVQCLIDTGEIAEQKRIGSVVKYADKGATGSKIGRLIGHVQDWLWTHPDSEFALRATPEGRYFSMIFYDDVGVHYARVGDDKYWSQFRPCTEENLRILLAVLRTIEKEGKS